MKGITKLALKVLRNSGVSLDEILKELNIKVFPKPIKADEVRQAIENGKISIDDICPDGSKAREYLLQSAEASLKPKAKDIRDAIETGEMGISDICPRGSIARSRILDSLTEGDITALIELSTLDICYIFPKGGKAYNKLLKELCLVEKEATTKAETPKETTPPKPEAPTETSPSKPAPAPEVQKPTSKETTPPKPEAPTETSPSKPAPAPKVQKPTSKETKPPKPEASTETSPSKPAPAPEVQKPTSKKTVPPKPEGIEKKENTEEILYYKTKTGIEYAKYQGKILGLVFTAAAWGRFILALYDSSKEGKVNLKEAQILADKKPKVCGRRWQVPHDKHFESLYDYKLENIQKALKELGGDPIEKAYLSATSQSNPPKCWNVRFILPLN